MRRIIIAWALLCLGFFCIGQSSAYWQSRDSNYNVSIPSTGCSQATTLNARMDGGQNTPAVTALKCGLVSDGVDSGFDLFYVFATNSTTNANLNWVSTSFGLTSHGTMTFTANNGYNGDGSTGYLDPSWTPSTNAVNWTTNLAGWGVCNLTANPAAASENWFGGNGATVANEIYGGVSTLPKVYYELNSDIDGVAATATPYTAQYAFVRTSSTSETSYQNAVAGSTATSAVQGLPNGDITLFAYNSNGTRNTFATSQLGALWAGTGFNSTQITAIYNRLHTYFGAVGTAAGC